MFMEVNIKGLYFESEKKFKSKVEYSCKTHGHVCTLSQNMSLNMYSISYGKGWKGLVTCHIHEDCFYIAASYISHPNYPTQEPVI